LSATETATATAQRDYLKLPQVLVGPPLLGQVHAGPQQLSLVLLDLLLQSLEQREGIGGGTCDVINAHEEESCACTHAHSCHEARERRARVPAKPAMMPGRIRRTFRALGFTTVSPSVTWPSPTMTCTSREKNSELAIYLLFKLQY
jgi:hypothetical protein